MGEQNTLYNNPKSYGELTCYPQPYMLPPSGNMTSFDPHYVPENHGHLPYMISQHNGVFRVPVNQMPHDHSQYSNNHQMFERNRSVYMEGYNGGFKRKNDEGYYGNFQCFYPVGVPMRFDFDHSRLLRGGQQVQAGPPHWWNHGHGVPYLQGRINGGSMEGGNIRNHGYQVAAMSRNSSVFMHPPPVTPHQGPHLYHPPPPPILLVQAQNRDIRSRIASTSNRHSTSTATSANHFQNEVDLGPMYMGPTPPAGLMPHEIPPNQLLMMEPSPTHILSEDALIALGEQLCNVGSGLSDNKISDHLKTKTFASSRSSHSLDQMPENEEPNLCVICQMEFEDEEKIGVLDCCHEYHVECIKKWLIVKNNCPICKSKALAFIAN